MMNERLTLQDLVDILSDKQNTTKKDAETFLRELIDLISETITEKDFVRIKDYGTFKLTKVNSRRSVDVNSGAPIEIPAHYKLSFIPDKVLREGVNKPFEHFESMEVPDDVQFEDKAKAEKRAQAKEIEKKIKAERKEEAKVEEAKKEEPKIVAKTEEIKKENITAEELEKETELSDVNEFLTTGIEEKEESTKKVVKVAPTPPIKEEKPREEKKLRKEYEEDDFVDYEFLSSQKKKRNTRIGIAAFLLILLIAGFWAYNKFMVEPEPIPIAQNNSELIITEDEQPDEVEQQPTEQPTIAEPANTTTTATQTGEKITVPAGATMRSLGDKYYGHISFWVYIFEENKDKIASPDALFAGMKLVIPPASKYGIDANSKESVEKARKEELKLFKEFAADSSANQ